MAMERMRELVQQSTLRLHRAGCFRRTDDQDVADRCWRAWTALPWKIVTTSRAANAATSTTYRSGNGDGYGNGNGATRNSAAYAMARV